MQHWKLSIEKLKVAQSARGCKVLSVTDTINGYDSITEEVLVTDEVDPGTEKARKELDSKTGGTTRYFNFYRSDRKRSFNI